MSLYYSALTCVRVCSATDEYPGDLPYQHHTAEGCEQLVGPWRADPADAAGVDTRVPAEAVTFRKVVTPGLPFRRPASTVAALVH